MVGVLITSIPWDSVPGLPPQLEQIVIQVSWSATFLGFMVVLWGIQFGSPPERGTQPVELA